MSMSGLSRSPRMIRVPINTTGDGCVYAITATLPARAGITNLTSGGGHYPATGILEVWVSDEKERITDEEAD